MNDWYSHEKGIADMISIITAGDVSPNPIVVFLSFVEQYWFTGP